MYGLFYAASGRHRAMYFSIVIVMEDVSGVYIKREVKGSIHRIRDPVYLICRMATAS